MKTKDILHYLFVKLKRNRKNFIFIIFLILTGLTVLSILTFRDTYLYNMNLWYKNSIAFRRLVIFPNSEMIDEKGISYNFDFNQLLNINHTLEIYNMDYDSYGVNFEELKSDKYTGFVELYYGSKNSLPTNIIGKTINEKDTGVAICSNNFYMMKDEEKHTGDYINGETLLNKTFTIKEPIYDYVNDENEIKEIGIYEKKFKVVGLFDASSVMIPPNSCYISSNDIKELHDTTFDRISGDDENTINARLLIVDSSENIKYVMNEVPKLGFESSIEMIVDYEFLDNLKILANLSAGIVSIVILFITILYIKKKNLDNYFIIGLLKTFGYKNKEIRKISFYEIIIIIGASLIGIVTIFEIVMLLIKIFMGKYFLYNNFFLIHSFTAYLITFLIIVVIPILVNYFFTNKNLKNKIVNLVRGERL